MQQRILRMRLPEGADLQLLLNGTAAARGTMVALQGCRGDSAAPREADVSPLGLEPELLHQPFWNSWPRVRAFVLVRAMQPTFGWLPASRDILRRRPECAR